MSFNKIKYSYIKMYSEFKNFLNIYKIVYNIN